MYAKVIQEASSAELLPIIKARVLTDSVVYSDSWKAYNALDVSEFKHLRVNHSVEYVAGNDRRNHINGIENFWSQAKRWLRKYNGVPVKNFDLFLKECEWCFNYGPPDQLLKTLRKWLKPYTQKPIL